MQNNAFWCILVHLFSESDARFVFQNPKTVYQEKNLVFEKMAEIALFLHYFIAKISRTIHIFENLALSVSSLYDAKTSCKKAKKLFEPLLRSRGEYLINRRDFTGHCHAAVQKLKIFEQ